MTSNPVRSIIVLCVASLLVACFVLGIAASMGAL